jgi:hypothetical protein
MKRVAFIIMSVVLSFAWSLSFLSAVFAQTVNRHPISGNGYRTNVWSADATQKPQTGSQHNGWLQGNEKQQEDLMGCYKLSSDLVHYVRDMRKALSKNTVDWPAFRNQYADMKKGEQLLSAEHVEFVSGLNNGQQSWWEIRLQKVTAVEFKLQARMGAIEGELIEKMPVTEKIRSLFIDLEGQFKEWQDCYGKMGADMDIENLDQKSIGKIRGLSGPQNP